MRNKTIILVLFLCIGIRSVCQSSICYNIYNNSNSDIVSWINFDNNHTRDSDYLIQDHFHRRIHDFCLTDMFWHLEDYKFDNFTPSLIVLIPAKSQFMYYVNNNCFKKGCYVVTFNRKDVEANLGYRLEEKWLYREKSIFIINRNRCCSYDLHRKPKKSFGIVIN